ncbi:Uncharacterised protein [Fusobacterium necrophorum subsp. necrophorum]|nr:Uncharacterised protein [Fusobacterium necrophorum subsp. necrophorum]
MSLKEATNEFQRDVIEKLLIELKSQRKVAERLESTRAPLLESYKRNKK